jgi:hypothetical protein
MYKAIQSILLLSTSLYASVVPEKILTKSCLNSYLNTYKSQKDHKAFVYARESETGKDRCGWGYGYESVKEAKKGAMKQCTGFYLNAECIIVDADGEYLVKEGDFSTISQPDDTPLSTKEEEKLLNSAKELIHGNCLPFFKAYLKDKGHKSFAYSLDTQGKYACGKTYGHSTLLTADKGALKSCEDNKYQRGTQKPKSPCRVYAKGNKIVLETKDFALVKVEKELSDEAYTTALKKAKTMVKKGPCLFQMQYYLRGSEHQAYFLAQDKEGKQVCGRSEGELSENTAIIKALKACDKNLREKNMQATCTLIAKGFEIVGEASFFVRKERPESKENITKESTTKESSTKKVNAEAVRDLFSEVKKKQIKNSKAKPVDLNKPQPLEKSIAIAAQTYNKNLPSMMDEELRLDKVGAKGSKMTFYYTLVHFTPQTMGANKLKSLMYEDIKTQVCTDKDTKMMLKKGMLVDYDYKGQNNKHITTFVYDAKTCGYLTNVEQIKKNILNMIKKK